MHIYQFSIRQFRQFNNNQSPGRGRRQGAGNVQARKHAILLKQAHSGIPPRVHHTHCMHHAHHACAGRRLWHGDRHSPSRAPHTLAACATHACTTPTMRVQVDVYGMATGIPPRMHRTHWHHAPCMHAPRPSCVRRSTCLASPPVWHRPSPPLHKQAHSQPVLNPVLNPVLPMF